MPQAPQAASRQFRSAAINTDILLTENAENVQAGLVECFQQLIDILVLKYVALTCYRCEPTARSARTGHICIFATASKHLSKVQWESLLGPRAYDVVQCPTSKTRYETIWKCQGIHQDETGVKVSSPLVCGNPISLANQSISCIARFNAMQLSLVQI
jgi:hypothetical protein